MGASAPGIVYVVPMPGVSPGLASGWMRSSLPSKAFVLPDVCRASRVADVAAAGEPAGAGVGARLGRAAAGRDVGVGRRAGARDRVLRRGVRVAGVVAVRRVARVVARGEVQVALGVEVHRAAEVAAAEDLRHPVVDDLLRAGDERLGGVVVREARKPALTHVVGADEARAERLGTTDQAAGRVALLAVEVRVVGDVDVRAPGREVRVQGDAEDALLVLGVDAGLTAAALGAEDLQLADLRDLGRILVLRARADRAGVPHVQRAAAEADVRQRPAGDLRLALRADGAAGVEHAAVLRHRDAVDLADVGVRRRRRVGRRQARRARSSSVIVALQLPRVMPEAHWMAPSRCLLTVPSV